jgi:hypothetical protein
MRISLGNQSSPESVWSFRERGWRIPELVAMAVA